jgi:NAD(P) transhydrogenase subunit alpha
MMPGDASAFYAKNVVNLLDIMVEQGEQGLAFKDFEQDEITQAALIRRQKP